MRSGDEASLDRIRSEMGDVLFVMANLARHLGVEPETAMQETNSRFLRRFQGVEALAKKAGRALSDMSLAELDGLWHLVKAEERKGSE